MHLSTMTALDFPKVQQELANYAACQLGKELATQTVPLRSLTQIRRAQQETTEAKAVIRKGKAVPFGGIQDVRHLVRRVQTGGLLRPEDLMQVADTIYGCRQLHAFLMEQKETAPSLVLHAAAFGRFDKLEDEIRRSIEHGTVSDRASKELKSIRKEIAVIDGRIQDRLQSMLKNAEIRQHLQEALVTMRDGRFVIPVRSASKHAVPGTVRGASTSGATVFVEPDAIRHLCEELENWKALEEQEIEKALGVLSALVAVESDALLATLEAAAELDLIFARGRLSYAWDAGPVIWNEAGLADLKGARHPLLGRDAVGNHIRLSPESRMLIVTGPNTGGKTLLLKTLGLLVLMAHSGLHIPVEADSTLCLFDDVRADIGDAQNLEQSLSTFSGHIANVAPMLAEATPRTLVLLDELGSGTDPHEGTGLGIALLEAFMQKQAYVLTTTHLREIKEFGRLTPGCVIAGMGFDSETLRPTYRLIYGALGESQGLVIAARAGLPASVVERAHQLVHGSFQEYRSAAEAGERDRKRAERAARRPAAPVPVPDAISFERPVIRQRIKTPVESLPENLSLVVASPGGGRARVLVDGEVRDLPIKGTLRRKLHGNVVVGDRVQVVDEQIVDVAKRRSYLAKRAGARGGEQVMAANLTRLLIVMAARQPDFRPNTLDRHLVYAEQYGLTPIICITKGDLVKPGTWQEWLKPYEALGYQTVVTSAEKGWGIEKLQEMLKGQFAAVIGHSGVGKSKLLSAVAGVELKVGAALNEKANVPGRHTTTCSEALRIDDDTWVVDTPGLRELGFWKLTMQDLQGAFPEFRRYAGLCRFANCTHRREPGCGVQLAVDQGEIPKRRYNHYLKLTTELHS